MNTNDVVNNVLTSKNLPTIIIGISVFIGLFILIVIVFKLLGIRVNVKSKHFSVGESEKERGILRQQCEWAESYCMSLRHKIPKDNTYDDYIAKYILERCYDEIIQWIMFNHLTLNGDYVKIKQQKIKMLVDSLAVNDLYRSDEFHEFLDESVRYIIDNLIHIREVFK